jgi:hypothetical protein
MYNEQTKNLILGITMGKKKLTKKSAGNTIQKKFVCKYKFSKDYNPVYANGAFGGVSSRGEIVINFFNERPAIPYEVEHDILGNTLSNPTVTKPEFFDGTHVRFIENGVTLNLETAKTIRTWLDEKITQLEGITNATNSNKKE